MLLELLFQWQIVGVIIACSVQTWVANFEVCKIDQRRLTLLIFNCFVQLILFLQNFNSP